MINRGASFYMRWISLLFISLAIILTVIQLVSYSRLRSNYPPEMTIAGVPVGGLDPQATSQRLLQIYTLPVEVHYADATILLDPALVGYEIDLESMLAAADLQRTGASFWGGYWNYLWNQTPAAVEIPLVSSLSDERLRSYLQNEIAARYDQPPTPAQPIPGSTEFQPGQPGRTLDIDRAVILIEDALKSPSDRVVLLAAQRTAAGRPTLQNLQILLQQIIDRNNFDGIVGVFLLDLQTYQELHFAYRAGANLSVQPDIAFTAASTIKIPIMVSVYRYFKGRLSEEAAGYMFNMIKESSNENSDTLMKFLDEIRGPLIVTEDMQTLGLKNTFMAGYFALGSPLLAMIETPANQRRDVTTDPDAYNQTTPSDIGTLLADIYECAQDNGGALMAAFPGQVDQTACQQMIQYLTLDKIGLLIQAGVPEGTQVAHKHGWVTDAFGVIHNISDAAIVYTPGGNFVLAIYTYHPVQIVFSTFSPMFTELVRAIYNYYNLPSQ